MKSSNFDCLIASIIRFLYIRTSDAKSSSYDEMDRLIFELSNEPELKKHPLISAVILNIKIEELCEENRVNKKSLM